MHSDKRVHPGPESLSHLYAGYAGQLACVSWVRNTVIIEGGAIAQFRHPITLSASYEPKLQILTTTRF